MTFAASAPAVHPASTVTRGFRFGVLLMSMESPSALTAQARRAEQLGYSTMFMGEHLNFVYSPFATASAIASTTSRLRIGTLMLLNDSRHPAVLAKEAATLDVLSEGRLELGIGAGWKVSDYTSIGMRMPSGAIRAQRLRESISIVKGLFADGPFSFSGTHFTIENLEGLPKPTQRPHPPIIVGGAGRAIMALAGAEANIAGINPALKPGPLSPEAVSMAAAEATVGHLIASAGERLPDIELNLLPLRIIVTPHRQRAVADVAHDYKLDEETVLDSPFFLIGSTQAITEKLQMLRDRLLVSYVVVRDDVMADFADVVERLASGAFEQVGMPKRIDAAIGS
jgi:probable F420-dependent oxidoreductase